MLIRCKFTDSFCSLVQGKNDNFDWLRNSSTPTIGTGPSGDYSTGSGMALHHLNINFSTNPITYAHSFPGRFAYIEASSKPPGYYADLRLPTLAPSPVYCLKFWYHLYGRDIGQLQVIVDDATGERIPFDDTKQGGNGANLRNDFPKELTLVLPNFATLSCRERDR